MILGIFSLIPILKPTIQNIVNIIKSLTILMLSLRPVLAFASGHENIASSGSNLDPKDYVGISFWLATAMMLGERIHQHGKFQPFAWIIIGLAC